MNVGTVHEILAEEMATHGLISAGWDFRIIPTRDFAGATAHVAKRITVSATFAQDATRADVVDVVRHEVAHALVGADNAHSAAWSAKALEIGCTARVAV